MRKQICTYIGALLYIRTIASTVDFNEYMFQFQISNIYIIVCLCNMKSFPYIYFEYIHFQQYK